LHNTDQELGVIDFGFAFLVSSKSGQVGKIKLAWRSHSHTWERIREDNELRNSWAWTAGYDDFVESGICGVLFLPGPTLTFQRVYFLPLKVSLELVETACKERGMKKSFIPRTSPKGGLHLEFVKSVKRFWTPLTFPQRGRFHVGVA